MVYRPHWFPSFREDIPSAVFRPAAYLDLEGTYKAYGGEELMDAKQKFGLAVYWHMHTANNARWVAFLTLWGCPVAFRLETNDKP